MASRSPSLSVCTCSSSASSISVPSNRLPRLWGEISGWSGSTIAAPTTVSSASEASTGNVFTLCSSGVSSGDTNRPPGAVTTTWVDSSALRSASARSTSESSIGVVLCTHTRTRWRPRGIGSSRIRTRPVRPSKSNGIASPGPGISIRRSSARWRSPCDCRKRTDAVGVTPVSATSAQSSRRWSCAEESPSAYPGA